MCTNSEMPSKSKIKETQVCLQVSHKESITNFPLDSPSSDEFHISVTICLTLVKENAGVLLIHS